MKVRGFVLVVLLAVVMAVVAGCGGSPMLRMYDGEARPAAEIAVIAVTHASVALMGVDSLQHRYEALRCSRIEVLPGEHVLTMHYSSWKGRSSRPLSLTMYAVAGETYVVKATAGYTRWSAWIERLSDSAIVAGHKPNW